MNTFRFLMITLSLAFALSAAASPSPRALSPSDSPLVTATRHGATLIAANTYGIPSRLLLSDGRVDISQFTEKMSGKSAYKNPKTGWYIEKDTAGHGNPPPAYKLKDKYGYRKATLADDGRILRR